VSTEDNKVIVARLTRELFNDGGDLDAVYELLAEDFVDHTPGEGSGDRESYRLRAVALRGPFSEIRATSDELVAEGDLVCERWTCRVRHTGEFMGLRASGERLEVLGFAMYRLRDGKIVELWEVADRLGLMRQLGAL